MYKQRKAPRVLQSVFASFADLYLYKLSRLIYDARVARWTVSFSLYFNQFLKSSELTVFSFLFFII